MIRTQTHKLIHRTEGQCELYDLVVDPQEPRNLHGRPEVAQVQRDLEKRLLDWYVHSRRDTFEEDPGACRRRRRSALPRLSDGHRPTSRHDAPKGYPIYRG